MPRRKKAEEYCEDCGELVDDCECDEVEDDITLEDINKGLDTLNKFGDVIDKFKKLSTPPPPLEPKPISDDYAKWMAQDMMRKKRMQEDEQKEIIKTNTKSLVHAVSEHKLLIISLLIAFGIFILALITFIIPYIHDHYAVEDTGLTYKNYFLNFQISRPNLDWSFDKNVTNFAQNIGVATPSSNILSGIVVESPNKVFVNVIVLTGSAYNATFMTQLANGQSQSFKMNFPNALVEIHPSTDGNSILLEGRDVPSTPRILMHEKIERHGDKIYVVMMAWSPEQFTSTTTSQDLNDTYNSFGYLS